MTSKLSVLVLRANQLQSSPDKVLQSLADIINAGYDKPRFKYNIVLTPRITSAESFLQSLGMDSDPSNSLLFLAVNSSGISGIDTTVDHKDHIQWHTLLSETLVQEIPSSCVIGTIGYHPYSTTSLGNQYEVTAFTSFAQGIGKTLLQATIRYCKILPQMNPIDAFIAKVFVEHELVPYYQKLGFQEIDRILVTKASLIYPEHSKASLEDSIQVSRDFNIAILTFPLQQNH